MAPASAEQDIPLWNVQEVEIEAMSLQALYVLEKRALDPPYREFLKRAQRHSELASAALSRSRLLERDPPRFRDSIVAYYYEESPSVEVEAAGRVGSLGKDRGRCHEELARRRKLPPEEQRSLEKRAAEQEIARRGKSGIARAEVPLPWLSRTQEGLPNLPVLYNP